MEYINSDTENTIGNILCCQCGVSIKPNPSNMCVGCVRTQVDITESIPKQGTLYFCSGCERYLQPPGEWVKCSLESRELLALCLRKMKGLNRVKLVDAGFVWTEPHSKRIKVKLTVHAEVFGGTMLEQVFIVEFTVNHQMCDDCHRTEAKDYWRAVVQVRQKSENKKTFYYLEQLILKYRAHDQTLGIKPIHEGLDFFYSNISQARKFVDFLVTMLPCKYQQSKKLLSHDIHSNIHTYKFTFSVEIVPVSKDSVVCLPKKLTQQLGGISPLCLVNRVTSAIHLIDPASAQIAEVSSNVFWRDPFTSICNPKQLVEYVVMDIEPIKRSDRLIFPGQGSVSQKHVLADVWLVKESDLGMTENTIHSRTHLGHILKPGDSALGYCLSDSNINDENFEKLDEDKVADVILVKKHYGDKSARRRARLWKLKHLDLNEVDSMNNDYNDFLDDLEEDPTYRQNVNIFRDPKKTATAIPVNSDNVDDPSIPQITLEEMLDDLHIDDVEMAEGGDVGDDDDDDDDEDINESDILARLKNQANILKELGGEVPDSIKALISDDGPTSFSLIAGYGDSDAEDDKEAGQEKVEKKIEKEAPPTKPSVAPSENKPLFPIMESVKAEADKMKVEENEQSRNEVKEKKEEPKKTELEDARLAANRKVIKLSARAKTLIKNSVTTAKARATDFVKTDQGLKPAKSSDVTQIKGSGTKDTQPPTLEEKPKPIAKPEPESKKKTKSKSVALTSSSSLEPPKTADVGKTVSAPSSDSVNHTTIVNTAGTSVSSSLAYTSTWSYGSEHPSGERRGFGFSSQPDVGVSKTEKKAGKKGGMIQFVKSDTVLNEPAAVEKAPVILEEKKLVAKTVTAIDPDTEATLKDLATVIKEKTTFLSEGKEPISAVQVMSIQLEMLTNAWSENALSSDFYHNWLMSVTRQLTSLEMSATPLNWACFWDRSHKRYYYRETQTGRVQWEYPVVAETATAKTAALASTPPLVDESAETALVSSYASDDAMDLCNTPPPPPLDDEDEQPPMPPPPPNISFGESEEQAADKDTTTEDTSCSNGEPPQAPPPPMISDSFDMNSKSPPPPPVSPPPLPPPPPTMSESTPPAPDPNLSLELSSFYSDLAALDPPPKPTAPAPLPPAPAPLPPLPPPPDSATAPLPPLPPLPPSQPPPPTDPPLPNSSATSGTKKKKKPKLGTGLSLKKRGYSSLMEKWQQIAEDEKDSD